MFPSERGARANKTDALWILAIGICMPINLDFRKNSKIELKNKSQHLMLNTPVVHGRKGKKVLSEE